MKSTRLSSAPTLPSPGFDHHITDTSRIPDGAPGGYQLQQKLPVLRPEFVDLHRRMLKEQWRADDESIDWSLAPVVEDLWVFRKEAREIRAHFIADCFCAEEFSLRGAGKRMDQLEEMDEKVCYAVMIADEYRHTEVMGRYQEKLKMQRPPDPRLVTFFEWSEALDVKAFCIASFVGETFALPVFPPVWRATRDPLLRAFLPKIWKDEKRHTDFIRLYLALRSPQRTPARAEFLSRIAEEVCAHQVASALEPNPLLMEKMPEPIQWMIKTAGKTALRKASRLLAMDFEQIGLPLPRSLRQRG